MFTSNEGDRIICIQNEVNYDTDVSKVTTLRWSVPHAYRAVSRCITYIRVYVNKCIDELCESFEYVFDDWYLVNLGDVYALVNLVKCVLDLVIFCDTCTIGDFNQWCLFWWK